MRFLLTGGAGFIGSHLAEALLDRGHQVDILDDLSTGWLGNLPLQTHTDRLHIVLDSVMNTRVLSGLVDDADVVVHLAAAVGVRLVIEKPLRTIETNATGTRLLLEVASKRKKPVFLASTSEVYGKSADVPLREDGDLILGPTSTSRWGYAGSKAIDEFLALAYWKEQRLPVIIGRFFNTVGPRQSALHGMVLPAFIHRPGAACP